MSLTKQVMKLRRVSPFIQLKRGKSGFPGDAYIPGPWGECSHIINRAPTARMPFKEKIFWASIWTVGLFSYPFYVTYMMYEWDRLDENM